MLSPQDQAWLDQEDTHVADTIRLFGQSITYVISSELTSSRDDGPPFAYTTGLSGLDHPELMIVGVRPDLAHHVLNAFGDQVRAGRRLEPYVVATLDSWPHRVVPEPVPNPAELAFGANRFYHRPDVDSVALLQLSYDDRHGYFPWEPRYIAPHMQPRPGTFRA